MRQALAVAAKAPRPGTVKTRLHGLLSPAEATELYCCFLKDTIESMERVPGAEVIVSYTPEGDEPFFETVATNGHRFLPQRGPGFGDRLFNTLAELLDEGFDSVAIMDADSPTLPPDYLAGAFEALAKPGDRVVLGPAVDGGYYLIGIKKPHRRLFDEIDWSTAVVLTQTMERAAELGLEVVLLPEWYDVDGLADFERLRAEVIEQDRLRPGSASIPPLASAIHTRRFVLSKWPPPVAKPEPDDR